MEFAAITPSSSSRLSNRATQVALLAFRCARQSGKRQDRACEMALKAYLSILPRDVDASDKVIAAIIDAVRVRPHWLAAKEDEETSEPDDEAIV